MALSVEMNLIAQQMDVVTAFLNGEVEEEIYMTVPEKLELILNLIIKKKTNQSTTKVAKKWLENLQGGNRKACKLRKAIYELRQSRRQWYLKADGELRKLGLTSSKSDPCLYVLKDERSTIFLTVHVDDIIMSTNNLEIMKSIKNDVVKLFIMKDMGQIDYCLGIKFKQDLKNGTITMSQKEIYPRNI